MENLSTSRWYTSSYSGANNNCVEVACANEVVGIRDTKARESGHLAVTPKVWSIFITTVTTH
jgi:hypothetical protein